jgi:hypothetical protein
MDYGIIIIATDAQCKSQGLLDAGYQFSISSSIPISRLKSPEDAYFTTDNFATTVIGCWSPKMHKAYWHRKHDGKEWEDVLVVDNTWTKSEQ